MCLNRTSIFAYVAVASLGVAATSLTASEAAAGFWCGRPFAGTMFGGPRNFSLPAPRYREKLVVHRPSRWQSKTVAVAEPIRVAKSKPTAVPEPAKLASTADVVNVTQAAGTANSPPAARGTMTTCLTKQYLETGAVLFRDSCTNEWAINSTTATSQAGSPAGGSCLTKENHPNGVVMFKDACTNEWAMNTAEQLAALPPTR